MSESLTKPEVDPMTEGLERRIEVLEKSKQPLWVQIMIVLWIGFMVHKVWENLETSAERIIELESKVEELEGKVEELSD